MSLILVIIVWSALRLKSYRKMVDDGSIAHVFDKVETPDITMTNPAHADENKATM